MGAYNFEIQNIPIELGAGSGCLYRGTMPWGLSNPDASREYLQELEKRKIDKVVVLVTKEELDFASDCQYPNAIQFYESHRITSIHFPMEDGGVPANDEKFDSLIASLSESLKKGERVLVHCMGGIGRTGLVISCLAKKILLSEFSGNNGKDEPPAVKVMATDDAYNGVVTQLALNRVRTYLAKAVETKSQMQYLTDYLNKGDFKLPDQPSKVDSMRARLKHRVISDR